DRGNKPFSFLDVRTGGAAGRNAVKTRRVEQAVVSWPLPRKIIQAGATKAH
ncbi:hypothetical protein TNCV_672661, partial [Trichonephila clavipes]